METLFKKKNLKFSGFHKEITKGEIRITREVSRQKRLSTLRDISFISDSKENINELGEKKTGIPSRTDMLKRWKEEKTIKQQQKGLKSVIKPGFCFKNPTSITNRNKTDDSKLNVQKLSNITGSQTTKLASTVLKSASQSVKPLPIPKKYTAHATKPTLENTKSQASQRSIVSKSLLPSKPSTQKSGPASLSLRTSALQGKATVKETKPIVQKVPTTRTYLQPSKVAPPLTNARIASKNAPSLPKVTQKLPLIKPKFEKGLKNTCVSSIDKPSKINFPKPTNAPSNKFLNKKNQTTKDHPSNPEKKESMVKTEEIFNCDISMIEPSIKRKSFAPQNFLFCPPSEWSFPFQIDISLPTSRLNGVQRTSSPMKPEENLKPSANDSSITNKNENTTLKHSIHEETSFKEKMKITPDDNKSQRSLSNTSTQDLNMNADISEMKMENKLIISTENPNISVSDSTGSSKMALATLVDINTEDIEELQENVTDATSVQISLLSVEPTLLVVLDNSTSQRTSSKDGSSLCVTSLSKTLKQDESLETAKCVTSEVSEDRKLITYETAAAVSLCESIDSSESQIISQMLVPIDNPPQNTVENYPGFCVSSSSLNPEQDKQNEAGKCSTSEILEDDKLVNIDSVDIMFSYKPIGNSVSKTNKEKSVMPNCNDTDLHYLCVTSLSGNSDQEKSLETVNCVIPKMLEGNQPVSASENGFNELVEIENNVEQCPNSLSESLKSFNLATSVAEKISEKVSIRLRKSKMPQRNALESINESIEIKGTPCATPKPVEKLIAEEISTPRRSARLSEKLNRSGSFESILNVEKPEMMNSLDLDGIKLKTEAPKSIANGSNRTPKSCKKNSMQNTDFTPRRSLRLSEMLRRSSSFENLFDVKRPSIMGSPTAVDFPVGNTAGITYDFDNLALEEFPKVIKSVKGRSAQVSKKVSLLYTPPTRKSTLRQSIRGDLMSFSPS